MCLCLLGLKPPNDCTTNILSKISLAPIYLFNLALLLHSPLHPPIGTFEPVCLSPFPTQRPPRDSHQITQHALLSSPREVSYTFLIHPKKLWKKISPQKVIAPWSLIVFQCRRSIWSIARVFGGKKEIAASANFEEHLMGSYPCEHPISLRKNFPRERKKLPKRFSS